MTIHALPFTTVIATQRISTFCPCWALWKLLGTFRDVGIVFASFRSWNPNPPFAGRYVRSYHKLGNASDMKNSLYLTVLYVTFRRKCLEPNGQPAWCAENICISSAFARGLGTPKYCPIFRRHNFEFIKRCALFRLQIGLDSARSTHLLARYGLQMRRK